MTASVQPSHAMDDRDLADRVWGRAGGGAPTAGATWPTPAPTWPSARTRRWPTLDPLAGIHAAVHRTADGREPWYPDQRLDVADAILGFTAGAAHAVGEQRRRGLLLPGYAADLVVLDTDIVAHPERIAEARVVATMLNGRWVHGAPPW